VWIYFEMIFHSERAIVNFTDNLQETASNCLNYYFFLVITYYLFYLKL